MLNKAPLSKIALLLFLSTTTLLAEPVNIALNRPVVADSESSYNRRAANAVDGESASSGKRWVSTVGMPHWIEIDVGAQYWVSQFKFWSGANGSYGYPLTAFSLQQFDGESWQDVHAEASHANSGIVDVSFAPVLVGERIRMHFTAGQDAVARLYELEVYGEAHALQVEERAPAAGASIYSLPGAVALDFNADIQLLDSTGIVVRGSADGELVSSGAATVSGTQLSIPVSLDYASGYEVLVPAGAVALAGDGAVSSAAIHYDFQTLTPDPQVIGHSQSVGIADPVNVGFDREIALLDGGKIALWDITAGEEVPLMQVHASGTELIIEHAGLQAEHAHRLLLSEGAVESVVTGEANRRVPMMVFSGVYEIQPTESFESGLNDFVTATTLGIMPYQKRSWGFLANETAGDGTKPGPGNDYTWIGTNRNREEDFAASPAYALSAGEQYTLSLRYSLTNAGLRVDLRDAPVRDETMDRLATIPSNSGGNSTGNITFSPEADGEQHFVFYGVGWHNYPYLRLDDISLVRTVEPVVQLDRPTVGTKITEGEPLVISGDAFGVSAEIASVDVYLDDRLVGEFSDGRIDLSVSDYDPGEQEIRIVARDTRNVKSEYSRPIEILFSDGTLEPFVQYSFREGLEGVTSNGSYSGDEGGTLRWSSSQVDFWFSTPSLFLQAGETYLVQFDARGDDKNQTLNLSLEPEDGYPVNPEPVASYRIDDTEWVTYQAEVSIEANDAYFLTFYSVDGIPWNKMSVDNIRIRGEFNSAPVVAFQDPEEGSRTTTLSGASLTLTASASDPDGEIDRVEFWNGPMLIGVATEAPYTLEWESVALGDLTVSAIAYDKAGGYSERSTIEVDALENKINLSTNMGTEAEESIRGMVYQDDGALVIGGILDPSFFHDVPVTYLSTAEEGDIGMVAVLSEDGRTVQSVSVIGEAVADLARDSSGNLFVAAGPTGMLKLSPDASEILWHYSPEDLGIADKLAHRIDAGSDGTAAALFSGAVDYGSQSLPAGDVAVVEPDGTWRSPLMSGSGGTYTTDVAVDSSRERVWITGWKNFHTFDQAETNPVDVPIFVARSYGSATFNERLIRGYDWDSDDDEGRWLNRLKNNMADTRTQRVTIAPNGDIYIGLEYDGGNTPIRDDPYDLSTTVPMVGGDSHHTNEFTTTRPKVGVIRLDPEDGSFKSGQYLVPRLSSGEDSTFRLKSGQLMVDGAGRVHVVGTAASGSPFSFDPLPGSYTGGSIHWVLSPDLSKRELVTRWGFDGHLHAAAVSPSGRVAAAGSYGVRYAADDPSREVDRLYRRRGFLQERAGDSDAYLVVGELSDYYSFQPGNHPRLFFGADEVAQLRYRATTEPYASMVDTLIAAREHNGDYRPFDESDPYAVSTRAKINAFLHIITGEESYAELARADVEWILQQETMPWADPGLKGLNSYWLATRVALAYDWCAPSEAWDDAFLFEVSQSLLEIGEVIINNGGSEQNPNPESNWQGARGAAGGLALLATDSRYNADMLDEAYSRVRGYINAAFGADPGSRGWSVEGLGYTYFPFGIYVGPFSQAMARNDGRDLRDETVIRAIYQSILTAPTPAINVYDYGGAKADWANDNMHIRGEGMYGQAFHFVEPELIPAARWVYDRLQGPLAEDGARWDDTRGGTVWSFLHYPADTAEQDPMEFYGWQEALIDRQGVGLTLFRNEYTDAEDVLAQFKARLMQSDGHDGPDGLAFRILGMDTAWAVGGGRNNPGNTMNQTSLYKVDPGTQESGTTNSETGEWVGEPLVKVDGGGHAIARMTSNNFGVASHKRWFVTDYDSGATGAHATFVVADTSTDGTWWQMPTSPFNSITVDGNTFTITAPNGATLKGTVLHPAGVTLAHGTRERGGTFALLNGGSLAEESELNPRVNEVKYVTAHGSGGDFLLAMTLQPSGAAHPEVERQSGTVGDAVVGVGTRTYTLQSDNVLYDGAHYEHAPAQIVFEAGDGVVESGETSQSVAYGDAPDAPEISPPAGQVFVGWDRSFDAVTRDMTVSAIYRAIEGTPSEPEFLRGSAGSSGLVILHWNDVSLGETGFTVEESMDGGTTWTTAAELPGDSVSVDLSGRTPETTYWYRVRAEGTEGPSAWSNLHSITTPAENLAPFFVGEPPSGANEGAFFSGTVQAEDPDDDSLTYSLVDGPDWLTLTNAGGGQGLLTGTPVGNGPVPITLSVTDGLHTPVELTFELVINAAPEITLVYPEALPVYLMPEHGTVAEITVSDSQPVSVEWSVVQGPAGTVIGTPGSLTTTLWFPVAGTYEVRATATDEDGAVATMEFAVLVDRQPTGEVVEVLNFNSASGYPQGGLRDAFPSTHKVGTTITRWHEFSTTDEDGNWELPLNPSDSAGIHGGRFFGGFVAHNEDTDTLNFRPNPPQIDSDGRISIKFSSSYKETSVNGAIFWTREDFKELDANASVRLIGDSQFEIGYADVQDADEQRWLVRADGQFYVSQSTIVNDTAGRNLNPTEIADELWAPYHPVAPTDLDFDEATADFSIPSAALGDLEALGVLIDADTEIDRRRFYFQLSRFTVQAQIVEAFLHAPVIELTDPVDPEVEAPFALVAAAEHDAEATNPVGYWEVLDGPGTLRIADENALSTTATASAAGTYKVRFVALDDDSVSFRNMEILVAPRALTPAEQWQQAAFAHLDGGVDHPDAAWTADHDRDGIPNLLEYALGGDPGIPHSAPAQAIEVLETDGKSYLTLTVPKNQDAADVDYIIEVSSDLSNWGSGEGSDIEVIHEDGTTLTVRDRNSTGPDSPRFIRLRVVMVP